MSCAMMRYVRSPFDLRYLPVSYKTEMGGSSYATWTKQKQADLTIAFWRRGMLHSVSAEIRAHLSWVAVKAFCGMIAQRCFLEDAPKCSVLVVGPSCGSVYHYYFYSCTSMITITRNPIVTSITYVTSSTRVAIITVKSCLVEASYLGDRLCLGQQATSCSSECHPDLCF